MENPLPNASAADTTSLIASDDNAINFTAMLQGRASSTHTQRAYARWIDRYLSDLAELAPTAGKARRARMQALPLKVLLPILNPPTLRTWLGRLSLEEQGKQALNQARASIITLASLLAEAGWLDDYTSAALTNVKVPKAESGQRQGRWLAVEQTRALMRAAEAIANSPAQRARNAVVIRMLCIMALRREELTEILWSDLHTQAGRPVLLVHGKGSKAALVDIPDIVMNAIEQWIPYVSPSSEQLDRSSYLIRGVYKGGAVRGGGITTDAIWRIVKAAAEQADLGRVAPHDLRRSVAGNLEQSGVPVETISRLLRHSNIAVTQQYLSKLPRQNEGAILMAELLDLDGLD
jgi:integrase